MNNKVKEYGFKALLKLPEIEDINCPCPDITRFEISSLCGEVDSSYVDDKAIHLILKNLTRIMNLSLSANRFTMAGLSAVIDKPFPITILDLSRVEVM